MTKDKCFINKFNLITKNLEKIIDQKIKDENLPILRTHASLFTSIPNDGEYIACSELIKNNGYSKSSLSELITKYESKGFLKKVICSEDKRNIYINLTDEGIKIKEKLKEIEKELNDKVLNNIDSNTKSLLNETTDILLDNTEKML